MIKNVLNLFDGISTGYLALKQAGIPFKNYYSSEVDKYAIQQTTHNIKEVIHLGDIQKGSVKDFGGLQVDLFCGGSPC